MMTVVVTATAQTETLPLDDIMRVTRTGKVQSRIESPHRRTPGKDPIPPSATAKIIETETTTDTTVGTVTGMIAGTETVMTAEIETDKTGITVTVNTGRSMTTAQETIVWTQRSIVIWTTAPHIATIQTVRRSAPQPAGLAPLEISALPWDTAHLSITRQTTKAHQNKSGAVVKHNTNYYGLLVAAIDSCTQ